jgi:iron complex transport system ATP-binding protein
MIELTDISLVVGQKHILNRITICFHVGQHTTILGPNGAGKSTLLRIGAKGILPSTGSVSYTGQSVNPSIAALARTRAFMSQHTVVPVEYTVEEMVLMGRYPHFSSTPTRADELIVRESLQRFRLSDYATRHLHTLSGGEQQRVHLARAYAQLLDYPEQDNLTGKFLFLDEPLNNLDIQHQYRLIHEIGLLTRSGLGIISVLHDINLALVSAHRVMLLKNGTIQNQLTPEEIKVSDLKELFELPFHISSEGLFYPAELTGHLVFTQ